MISIPRNILWIFSGSEGTAQSVLFSCVLSVPALVLRTLTAAGMLWWRNAPAWRRVWAWPSGIRASPPARYVHALSGSPKHSAWDADPHSFPFKADLLLWSQNKFVFLHLIYSWLVGGPHWGCSHLFYIDLKYDSTALLSIRSWFLQWLPSLFYTLVTLVAVTLIKCELPHSFISLGSYNSRSWHKWRFEE